AIARVRSAAQRVARPRARHGAGRAAPEAAVRHRGRGGGAAPRVGRSGARSRIRARRRSSRDARERAGRAAWGPPTRRAPPGPAAREDCTRAVRSGPNPPPASAPAKRSNVMVFVNADSQDLPLAQAVASLLSKHQVECYWPLATGAPEEIRRDLEDNLSNCDGVLLIYGSSSAQWVRTQLRQGRRIISQRRRPPRALAVYEGPPVPTEAVR